MVKLIALYKKPEDTAAFDEHYNNVHTPLALKIPGLQKLEVTRIVGTPQGPSEYYLMAELCFPDQDTFNLAMRSDENKAAGKDLMGFAGNLVTFMVGEVK
jgi:uncharacterized protein (TIGR02118 family)